MEGGFVGVFVFTLPIGYTSVGAEYFMAILSEKDQRQDDITFFTLTIRFSLHNCSYLQFPGSPIVNFS